MMPTLSASLIFPNINREWRSGISIASALTRITFFEGTDRQNHSIDDTLGCAGHGNERNQFRASEIKKALEGGLNDKEILTTVGNEIFRIGDCNVLLAGLRGSGGFWPG